MSTRKASARTGTVSISDAKRAMTKASTPAGMKPRLDCDHPGSGQGCGSRFLTECAGLGVRLPSSSNNCKVNTACPTQPQQDTLFDVPPPEKLKGHALR